MISLAEKVNGEVETNTANVDRAVNTANTASSRANQTLETAQEAINEAETTLQAANTAKTGAQSSAAAAASSASAAEASKTAAAQSAEAAAESAAEAEQIAEGLGGFNGSAASVTAVDTQGLVVGGGKNTNAQALFNALALKVAQELVSNTKLAQQLADYVKKTDIVQTESTATNKVPSSAYLKQVKADINSNLASQIAVVTYSKSNIPIVAGDDFFANIPVDIDTSVYRWVFPILSDVSGYNSTKINISTCIWQNGQVHIKGNNQATDTANISIAGVVIAIK